MEAEFIACPSDPSRVQAWNEMQVRLRSLWRPGVREIVDHIGIGSDFDGILVPPEGLEDVSMMGKIFDEMRRRGYSETEVSKVAGANLLAVMRRIQG